jgi:hypothetical protein
MNTKTALLIVVAWVAGATGGVASRFLFPDDLRSLRSGPVRATRFDLVGEGGKTIASLAPEPEFAAALVFWDSQRQPRAKLGVLNGPFAPVLEFRGRDGKSRILAVLRGPDDHPSIELQNSAGRSSFVSVEQPSPYPASVHGK